MSTHLSPELYEKIRIKAYLLWEKAGCPGGDGSQFWVEAEKVMTRMAKLSEAKKAKAQPAVKAKPAADPSLVTETKPGKKKKKEKKDKSEKKKSGKKKEKK